MISVIHVTTLTQVRRDGRSSARRQGIPHTPHSVCVALNWSLYIAVTKKRLSRSFGACETHVEFVSSMI